ncbi:hypothetical protein CcrC1_gp191 [Caulobacter phage C1]|nr:hypothetical protein CcrC1_gp191 [Caulobacter phage C1]UTU08420.1 hypothetical protein CcrC2_gp192 [Caulobacter phage C2]UTU08937.1 hypothetical protein CcrJ4_gp186 [Caulobacter phage J4]UTU09493.1 hypothetical protein CcrBL47_gp207 [Caulobacter phage BL47]UTU10053.1 hypothetical protein CcrRB23_gp191 [Caulobacter phage RB23]WGN97088.1 hypothetical protein [Bertelyvirus sp.]
MEMQDYLGIGYLVIAVLTYLGIIIALLVNPQTDDEEWQMLLWGIIIGFCWGVIAVCGLLFWAIPEGFKALHRWLHRPKPQPPVPPARPPVPADKLDVAKD